MKIIDSRLRKLEFSYDWAEYCREILAVRLKDGAFEISLFGRCELIHHLIQVEACGLLADEISNWKGILDRKRI